METENNINAITKSPNMGIDSVDVIVARMLDGYKQDIKVNYTAAAGNVGVGTCLAAGA